MGNAQFARPAVFDRSAQNRRSMIAKINIARQQIVGMDEDSYRQLLFDATGHMSLTKCSDAQLSAVIAKLVTKGFRPMPGRGAGKKAARHPVALKAMAMWRSLYQLGVVRNGNEAALEAFAKGQLKCDRLVWARQSDGYKLIEALKGMAVRAGWVQVDHKGAALGVLGLRASLCHAIVAQLKQLSVIPMDWTLDTAAYRLCGIDTAKAGPFTAQDYDRVAAALSGKLRKAMGLPS